MKTFQSLSNPFLSTLTKRSGFFIFCLVFCICSVAQPPTPINGVVNTYHKVVSIDATKACIIVDDPTGLNLNTMVMLVQMKGADINTAANSASFGDVTAINNAGNYEIGTICYIKDDSVFLFHSLLNNYTPSTGKVQLVQFGEYLSADVTDTLKAAPWDSASGMGGVIAIYALNDIFLNAPIYADSSGFRGGVFSPHSGTCFPLVGTNYAYDVSSTNAENGAYKGEGIANIPGSLDGGKGAPANGGGGGNNHNNSGGGGANLSAGGIGGGNSSNGPFNCNISNNHGRGGKALNSSSGTKIFSGGGGGAGHANNGSQILNYGGNGGGMVFIWANTLTSNGEIISANGGKGGASTADGAGGGGSGGTIIINVNNYADNVLIQANGGEGGLSDNGFTDSRCFGGGGGGSGGTIYFTSSIPSGTKSVLGGIPGAEINRFGTCSNLPGMPGVDGNTIPNYTFTRSTSPAAYCRFLLPVKLIFFHAELAGKKVQLDWQIENPELAKFYSIEKINSNNERTILVTIAANDVQRIYSTIDNNPSPGNNLYRLKIIEKDNSVTYSEYRSISLPYPANEYSVYPNPATNKITINGNFVIPTPLKLSDISGKLILQQQLTGNIIPINLPALSPGIYLLRIGEKTQKLIIH